MICIAEQKTDENKGFLSPYSIPGLKPDDSLPPKRNKFNENEILFFKLLPEDIITASSRYFNIPIEDIKSRTRKVNIVYARKICVYLMRRYTNLSLILVGSYFSDALTDHTSVRHSQNFIHARITGRFKNLEILHDVEKVVEIAKGIDTIKFHK